VLLVQLGILLPQNSNLRLKIRSGLALLLDHFLIPLHPLSGLFQLFLGFEHVCSFYLQHHHFLFLRLQESFELLDLPFQVLLHLEELVVGVLQEQDGFCFFGEDGEELILIVGRFGTSEACFAMEYVSFLSQDYELFIESGF
jgi:hypothetical protein